MPFIFKHRENKQYNIYSKNRVVGAVYARQTQLIRVYICKLLLCDKNIAYLYNKFKMDCFGLIFRFNRNQQLTAKQAFYINHLLIFNMYRFIDYENIQLPFI